MNLHLSLLGHLDLSRSNDVFLRGRRDDAAVMQVLFGQLLVETQKVREASTHGKLFALEVARVGSETSPGYEKL